MQSLEHQEGGDHYKKCKIQPIEFINENGLNFCQGNIVKYVVRYKSKNGIEDLKKAKHYIDLLIDFERKRDPKEANFTVAGDAKSKTTVINVEAPGLRYCAVRARLKMEDIINKVEKRRGSRQEDMRRILKAFDIAFDGVDLRAEHVTKGGLPPLRENAGTSDKGASE
jgi:hypothetical protein